MTTKKFELEERKKRDRIQRNFWSEVGTVEHISLPKLKKAIEREFKCKDDRFIHAQIELMQTEARIKVESKVKVWIEQPQPDYS